MATFFIGASFVVAVGVYFDLLTVNAPVRTFTQNLWTWIPVDQLQVHARLFVDPLSMTMVLFVTGISCLIHLYSIGYMKGDRDYPKFFLYMNLFVASMLILVLGSNLLVTFVGWEGVGTCSYWLVSFWFTRDSAASAGKKAFVYNRIGDVASCWPSSWSSPGCTRSSTRPSSTTSAPSAPATSPPSACCSWSA